MRINFAFTNELIYSEEVIYPINELEIKDGWYYDEDKCTIYKVLEKYIENYCRNVDDKESAKAKEWFHCKL